MNRNHIIPDLSSAIIKSIHVLRLCSVFKRHIDLHDIQKDTQLQKVFDVKGMTQHK